eukprot:scaffold71276_cov54-Phaeocystis_antarctica.AAC.3
MHVLLARVRGEVGGRHEDQVEIAEEIAEVAAEIEIAIEIAATSRAAAEHPHAVRHPAERGRRAGPRPALWAPAPPLATRANRTLIRREARASRCRGRRRGQCRCVRVSPPSAAPRSQGRPPRVRAHGFGARFREGRAPTFLVAGGGAFPATHSSAAGASRSACVASSATTRLLTPPSPSATTATPPDGLKAPSATLPNRRGAVELPCVEPTWLGWRQTHRGQQLTLRREHTNLAGEEVEDPQLRLFAIGRETDAQAVRAPGAVGEGDCRAVAVRADQLACLSAEDEHRRHVWSALDDVHLFGDVVHCHGREGAGGRRQPCRRPGLVSLVQRSGAVVQWSDRLVERHALSYGTIHHEGGEEGHLHRGSAGGWPRGVRGVAARRARAQLPTDRTHSGSHFFAASLLTQKQIQNGQ